MGNEAFRVRGISKSVAIGNGVPIAAPHLSRIGGIRSGQGLAVHCTRLSSGDSILLEKIGVEELAGQPGPIR
jgi:hypothetical protein